MPIYEYECNQCEEVKEIIASQKSRVQQVCKACGSNMTLKVSGHCKTPGRWKV